MSRLERRDSDSRRRRSRFDQEPSPKRSRRDSHPETEKHLTNNASDVRKNSDWDQNNHVHLKDAGHHEAPSRQDSKTERAARRVSDQKNDVQIEGTRHSSPKRNMQDSKPETERHLANNTSNVRTKPDQDLKSTHEIQDSIHNDAPSRQDGKTERAARRVSDQKRDVQIEGTKHSSPKRNMQDVKLESERHLTNNTSDVRKGSDQELKSTLQFQDSTHHDALSRQEYKTERGARKVSEQKRDVHIEGMKHSYSPKRSRQDNKTETERHHTNITLDDRKNSDLGQKNSSDIQDSVRFEAPSRQDDKTERAARKESDQKRNVPSERMNTEPSEMSQHRSIKRSSDPAEVPRSQSYFQHDERGNAGQAGRSSRQREPHENSQRRESKDQVNRKRTNEGSPSDAWRHDGYFELEANPKPPAKKRSFREQKTEKPEMENHHRRRERNHAFFHRPDQTEKQFARERFPSRRDGYYERGSFGRRHDHQPNKIVDKWKHDLFNEANKSPSPRNEEDHLAKIEALLAS